MLFNGMDKTSHWAALYFVALMTFGNYVLFNLLVAILVEGFSSEVGGGALSIFVDGFVGNSQLRSSTGVIKCVCLPLAAQRAAGARAARARQARRQARGQAVRAVGAAGRHGVIALMLGVRDVKLSARGTRAA